MKKCLTIIVFLKCLAAGYDCLAQNTPKLPRDTIVFSGSFSTWANFNIRGKLPVQCGGALSSWPELRDKITGK